MSLLYTPSQLRDATAIPAETYRHWKKALPPLRRNRGHSPCFTPGDLVAVAVVRILTDLFGIRVGGLTALAEPLFEVCHRSSWAVLERSVLVLDFEREQVGLRAEQADRLPSSPAIVVPLGELVADLREKLLATDDASEQGALRFPPTPLAAAGGRP